MIKIHFCGGAEFVTGANYLVDTGTIKFIVECGMIQGSSEADDLNYESFPYDPSEVSFMIATHTHIDHIGRIPKLVKDGFNGEIYSTHPTKDFANISMQDTVSIMEHDYDKKPLYSREDVSKAISKWRGREYGEIYEIGKEVSFRFRDAGHILGSAIVEMWVLDNDTGKRIKIVFSGDLGNHPSVLLKKYEFIKEADYVLIESAYGDRTHEQVDIRKDIVRQAVKDVIERKSVLLVPTFSIERTQDILYELNDIIENHIDKYNKIDKSEQFDVYLDSPLGIKATKIYKKYTQYYNAEARNLAKVDQIFDFPYLNLCESREDSMAINHSPNPKMIMAGSGMSTGGRILYHEKQYLSNPKNIMLFVGYQGPNTLGRQILDGKEKVYIRGDYVENKIEVRKVDGYSGHADQTMLLEWMSSIKSVKKVFVVQGESESANYLAHKIKTYLDIEAIVPTNNQVIELI